MVYVCNFNKFVLLGLERVRRKRPKPTPLPQMRLWLLVHSFGSFSVLKILPFSERLLPIFFKVLISLQCSSRTKRLNKRNFTNPSCSIFTVNATGSGTKELIGSRIYYQVKTFRPNFYEILAKSILRGLLKVNLQLIC